MKVNVTMLARNRHRLTEQALDSLAPRPGDTLTVLDDGSQPLLSRATHRNEVATGGAGPARNQVIGRVPERLDLLYLSDNDVYFLPRWLDILTELWPFAYALGFRVLGGQSHPYNAQAVGTWPCYSDAARRTVELRECLAVATQSWLMDWETWDHYGPFAEAPGVRQSEDVAMCQRLRDDGFKVGYVWPHVVLNTSRTDTFGKDVPGKELLTVPDGVVME